MVRFTSHAMRKFGVLKALGFQIRERQVLEIIRKPSIVERTWKNRFVAVGALNSAHVLRVVFEKENGNIIVVTFYRARRARYEGKLR